MNDQSLPDKFLSSKHPQFQPLLNYWGHLKIFYSNTTNCGVNGKNSPSTPQNVVSKVNFRRHPLQKFTFDTTFCGVEGEYLPLTPQFLVAKVNFCHRHHNLWCLSTIFSSAPNILIGAKILGVWKTKSYLEDFRLSLELNTFL